MRCLYFIVTPSSSGALLVLQDASWRHIFPPKFPTKITSTLCFPNIWQIFVLEGGNHVFDISGGPPRRQIYCGGCP